MTVFLDTGPLGILTNPKRPPETVNALTWAVAMRRAGHRFIVPAILDGDVLIAAQALDMGLPPSDFIIATVNVGHLALFVPADLWTNITP